MTVEDFRRNLRGTNDGEDLPAEFLGSIFASIRDNEITLKDDDRSWYSMDDDKDKSMTNATIRAQKWQTESEDAMKQLSNKIQDSRGTDWRKKVAYHVASNMRYVRPMFEVSRWPFLSAFSQFLEKATEDPRDDEKGKASIVTLCLEGFKHAIHISCIFCMSTERDTFITSLSKFTQLMTLREMKLKHIYAINTLLNVAVNEANFLQSTWHLPNPNPNWRPTSSRAPGTSCSLPFRKSKGSGLWARAPSQMLTSSQHQAPSSDSEGRRCRARARRRPRSDPEPDILS